MDNKINLSIREKVNAWYVQNTNTYKKFVRNFERTSDSNMDFFRKLLMVVSENIPEEMEELWQCVTNGGEDASCSIIDTYGDMLERCALEGHCFSVNIASGEVKEYEDVKSLQLQKGDVLFSKQISDAVFKKMPRKIKGFFGFDGINPDSEGVLTGVFVILSAALIAVPKFIQNLVSKQKQHYKLAYALSYFMIFDHGLMRVQKKLSSLMISQNWDSRSQIIGDMLTKELVNTSVSHGYDTKTDWATQSKEEDEETAEAINSTLEKVKGSGGRRADFGSIEEMCIGDKDQLMQFICQFLDEEKETVSLAYLFYVMKVTGHINVRDYKAFHRAVKMAFPERDIKGVRKPQTRYSEIIEVDKTLLGDDYLKYEDYNSTKWKHAHKVIKRWLPFFRSVD